MSIIITTIIITVVIVRGEKTLKKNPRPAFFLVSRTFPQCFFFFLFFFLMETSHVIHVAADSQTLLKI